MSWAFAEFVNADNYLLL